MLPQSSVLEKRATANFWKCLNLEKITFTIQASFDNFLAVWAPFICSKMSKVWQCLLSQTDLSAYFQYCECLFQLKKKQNMIVYVYVFLI